MLWTMLIKDLKIMFRDKKALLIALIMPAVLTTILGFSIGRLMSGETDLSKAEIAVVNLDNREDDLKKIRSLLSSSEVQSRLTTKELTKIMDAAAELDVEKIIFKQLLDNEKIREFVSYRIMEEKPAMDLLQQKKLTAVIKIPPGFFYDVFVSFFSPFSNRTYIEVIKNPDQELKSSVVEAIIRSFTDTLSAGIIAKSTFLEVSTAYNLGPAAYQQVGRLSQDVMAGGLHELKTRYLTVPGKQKVSGFQYYAAAMACMFVLYTSSFGARYLLSERQASTYQRQLLGNVNKSTIMASRFLTSFLFAYSQLWLLILFSMLLFKIRWGNLVDVALFSLVVASTIAALTVLLSATNLLVNDSRISNIFEIGVIQLLAMVGGSYMPYQIMPPVLANIGRFTPNGSALNGYLKLMQGYHLSELTSLLEVLGGSAVLFLVGGVLLMKLNKE